MMDKALRKLLENDMKQEADWITQKVNSNPNVQNAEVPPEMWEELLGQIKLYEANKLLKEGWASFIRYHNT